MAQHNDLGKKGEQLAIDYLLECGYNIVTQNYRFERAEIDIIATKDNILVVIEVKARTTSDFGNPQDFVKPKQIKNLIKAVDHYVLEHNLDMEIRFDIIGIIKKNSDFIVEHIENAFYHF